MLLKSKTGKRRPAYLSDARCCVTFGPVTVDLEMLPPGLSKLAGIPLRSPSLDSRKHPYV